jgi:uncharacterized protein
MMTGTAVGRRPELLPRLAAFCSLVRARGVPAGVGAEVDLGNATSAIDIFDRPTFRSACQATLARSPEELTAVGAAFDEFWAGEGRTREVPWTGAGTAVVRPPPPRTPRRTSGHAAPRSPEEPPVSVPLGTWSATAPTSEHRLRCRPERELRSVRDGARRLRRFVATLPGRRRARSRRGPVDARDTLRSGLRHGGEWVEFRREAPRLRRGEFVVLWDVSGSMREHESECYLLAQALASVSRGARIFTFSTTITEVTAELRRHGYRRAADEVGRVLDRADGGTRIGQSLSELVGRSRRVVHDRSTVVLLSDGWDLGELERTEEALAELAQRAHAVVWVNPYARRPGFEPRVGALRVALPYLDLFWGPEDFRKAHPPRTPPRPPVDASPV